MALLALLMSQKSPWDKYLGGLLALAVTLGSAAIIVAGVTTL
jgi:hypothetical protein